MIKKTVFIFYFFLTSLYADAILQKKLELLEMMQKDSLENIYTTYANLLSKKDKQKSKELLLKAINNQEYKAMKLLGYKLFEDEEIEDALVLLCKASILGDIGVAEDIYLIPILFDITREEIEKSCQKASKELFLVKDERIKINLFEKRRAKKALSYYEYFDFLTSAIQNLTEAEYQSFLADADKKNIPRVKKHKRLSKVKLQKSENMNWEYLRHVDRIERRKKGINDIFLLSWNEDLKFMENELREKLKYFNALRAKNKTLSFEEFLNLIGKK